MTNTQTTFDVLGDILDTLRLRGSIFFRSELASPWGMLLQPTDSPRFHIALRGQCVVGSASARAETVVQLDEMDIVVLPHGNKHWIADRPGRSLIPSERAGEACELGNPLFQQGEITNKLICGIIRYEQDMQHPILSSLPDVLHLSGLTSSDPVWLTVQLIDREMEGSTPSSATLTDRLTEILFLQLLNRHIDASEAPIGFLGALADRRVHRILELIHDAPQNAWTLEQLGQAVGMSRATVARRFSKAVGMPVLAYLGEWRMLKAHYLLKYSSLAVEAIAEKVGFSGARSLSKAFQRKYDATPAELRKRLRGAVQAGNEGK